MTRIIALYRESFTGINSKIWMLSLVTLINRSGTMVIPFLSLYMSTDLGFDYLTIGWVLMFFGAGSLLGSYIGGQLSDYLGFFHTMILSLLGSGFGFFVLQYATGFWSFGIGIFLITTIADTFRPACFTAVESFSPKEDRTRSLSLIRLAINLGFSAGPFLGGLMITLGSYRSLFIIDGITCIVAGCVLYFLLTKHADHSLDKSKVNESQDKDSSENGISPLKNRVYIIYILGLFLMAMAFLQFFTTVPLYFKEVHGMNEFEVGIFMTLNGLLIVLAEMPLVHYFEAKKTNRYAIIALSTLMIGACFVFFNVGYSIVFLVLSVVLVSFGEMLGFPFSNTLAIELSSPKRLGAYMGLYSMAFSMAHLFSPKLGFYIIAHYGYNWNWWVLAVFSMVSAGLIYSIKKT